MGEWIEFTSIDLGYYNPETGKDIPDITGMRNRPGKDPFAHKGNVYPEISKDKTKVLEWHQKGRKVLLVLDIPYQEAIDIINDESDLEPILIDDPEDNKAT